MEQTFTMQISDSNTLTGSYIGNYEVPAAETNPFDVLVGVNVQLPMFFDDNKNAYL